MNGLSNQPFNLTAASSNIPDKDIQKKLFATKEVDPKFGVTGIFHRLEKEGHFKAVSSRT